MMTASTAGYPTTEVRAGRQPTRLLDVGSGAPVVVLHGWGGRIESMAPAIDCLRSSFRILAPDLPGFGDSPPPKTTWGSADYAIYVRDVLRQAGIERAHFLGHSFGAKISLYLAATHRGAVEKLVAVDASGIRTPPSPKVRAKRAVSKLARAAGGLGKPGRYLRDAAYRRLASADYEQAGELRPILVRVVNEDLSYLLPRIAAPTLLVWGGEDRDTPLEHGRKMERLIPDAGLVVFESAGHFSYLDEPGRFCRVVRHFLDARPA